jgi:20S proteasome subunit beta 1
MVKNMIYTNKKFLEAAVIVGGFDPVKGGQIYQVPLGEFLINENLAIGGSGSGYISSYCDMNYKPNMTQEQCREFLVSAVSLAMYRDSSSGGVVRILNITKDGASREYFSHNQLPIK